MDTETALMCSTVDYLQCLKGPTGQIRLACKSGTIGRPMVSTCTLDNEHTSL